MTAILPLLYFLSFIHLKGFLTSGPETQNRISNAPENLTSRAFTSAQQQAILELHNKYRSHVSPPAANMRRMSWDKYLEQTAQQWADGCMFEHGMPPGVTNQGQNLYTGDDKTGISATKLWHKEVADYDYWKKKCREPSSEEKKVMCGHYTQMVWAESFLLGCAIAYCPHWNLIACHYKPQGNVVYRETREALRPYETGIPCSQCNTGNGGTCHDNLCASKADCKENGNCDCKLECLNCGKFKSKSCTCECTNGWDSLDCSRPCKNAHRSCGRNPGFPTCSGQDIRNVHCRQMCSACSDVNLSEPLAFFHPNVTGESGQPLPNICCGGRKCPFGYVLDETFCECKLFCPGPICFSPPLSSKYTITLVLITYVLRTIFQS